ncbi:Hypothetical protein CAP_3885 [Chondromyces apiculatus DSM 436]|uniref:Uncharacterized protein n=1 Tax=Chondromyces apiculatus DSM 436 TaxID=1192034 RepID=A0A017T6K3_9BACT|nr:Hypothetical protein CAP_3885 [Chondromyces apiculatus DSM 436]
MHTGRGACVQTRGTACVRPRSLASASCLVGRAGCACREKPGVRLPRHRRGLRGRVTASRRAYRR